MSAATGGGARSSTAQAPRRTRASALHLAGPLALLAGIGCNELSGVDDLEFRALTESVASASAGQSSSSGSGGASGGGPASSSGSGGGSGGTGGSAGGPAAQPVIYATTQPKLWRFDPTSLLLESVDLIGCELDELAIPTTGPFVGAATSAQLAVVSVDGTCQPMWPSGSPGPYALHYASAGTVAAQETLVGYLGADFLHLQTTGPVVLTPGALTPYTISGDSIAVDTPDGPRAWATVRGTGCSDCLAEVDPTTGEANGQVWSLGAVDVLGLAASGDRLYGFTKAGAVIEIDAENHSSTVVVPAGGLYFEGAASPPSAP